MSQSTAPTPLGTPNSAGLPTTITDQLVGTAKDLPKFLTIAESADPDTAAKWTGKALLASKTFWGAIGVIVLSAAVKRYSLGWDDNTVDLVVGTIDIVALAALRKMSAVPITGWFRKATVVEAVAAKGSA